MQKRISPITFRTNPAKIDEIKSAAAKLGIPKNRFIAIAIDRALDELNQKSA